ncbi:hypothetical protein HYV86_01085 [Candidatus Woesearchaeota archaeon]|nr:hypothetical protein [Candidatus Woesearchaeota archaeon]
MQASDLTVQHIEAILSLYVQYAGRASLDFIDAESVLADIQSGNRIKTQEGYRIGSQWTGHSKLAFRVNQTGDIIPDFNPNLQAHERGTERYQAAERASQEFQTAALEYLIGVK